MMHAQRHSSFFVCFQRNLSGAFLLLALCMPMTALAEYLDDPNDSLQSLTHDSVIDGQRVTSDSRIFKATVRLHIQSQNGNSLCSGTLIAKDMVLTAAHCLKDVMAIRAEVNGGQNVMADAWQAHPSYTKIYDSEARAFRSVNDIGMVKLSSTVSSRAVIAELPDHEVAATGTTELVLAGFGQTSAESSSNSAQDLYFGWTYGTLKNVENIDWQIELTGPQLCFGDSGGPLFFADKKRLVIVGVNSHVRSKCQSGSRTISVWSKLNWIKQTAKSLRKIQSA